MKTTISQIARFRRRSAPIHPGPSLFQIVLDRDDRCKVAALCERGVWDYHCTQPSYQAQESKDVSGQHCSWSTDRLTGAKEYTPFFK